ncbi:MAG TPA: amidase [Terriglobales bacterium]|jgi:Asp-tRNA(Asn)/Glu-tRNA(Gln) amidotransferase A subunit family amidase|nr:amidase [Terriglobales bacterium]
MTQRTISEVSELVHSRPISPVELTRECLQKINALNSELNAFITVTAESALREAALAQDEIAAGKWRGPLHGIPVGLKDLIDTAGVRTTAASRVFADRVPVRDAEIVARLREAGAVLVGKQNLHEFAYGGSSVISAFGIPRNPIDSEYIAGGSSGGSAAAVGSGMCYAAIGTDTAGSVREPAALCGLVGLKPTYGLISTEGIIPLSPSLDHAGPITRSVQDAAILLDALTGTEWRHSESLDVEHGKWRVGIPRQFFFEDLDSEVATAVEAAIDELELMGCVVADVDVRVDTDRTLQAAEAYAEHRQRIASSADLYDPETLRRVRTGENISNEQHRAALRELGNIRREIAAIFDSVDVLVTPTTPIPAPRLSNLTTNIDQLRPTELVLLRNTRPANVWGTPAISVPCGRTSEGLPIGLQIIGPMGRDARVLQVARAFERACA